MEINGLPLHPLVVHAAVVFGPLSALARPGLRRAPAWRDRLRWPTLALVLIAFGSIWRPTSAGENFLESRPLRRVLGRARGARSRRTRTTPRRCGWSSPATRSSRSWPPGCTTRTGALRIVLNVLLVVGAIGDAGLHGPHRRRRRPGGLVLARVRPSTPARCARRAAAGTTRPGPGRPLPPRRPRRARTRARRRRACSRAGSPRSSRRGRGTPRSAARAARARARRTGCPGCR